MKKQIIKIDEEKCVGCGLCASACKEGAIGMVDGKAKLLREDYCDGLGNCLPVCPTGAISFEQKEVTEKDLKKAKEKTPDLPCGCPGTNAKEINRTEDKTVATKTKSEKEDEIAVGSELRQWPVQIKLVPINAPYFKNANLLIAADCAAYAYGNFHKEFMKNKVTLIGCPKLDEGDYSEKLTEIIKSNDIKSVTVVRMEVPCCGGIENAVKTALQKSGKMIPWQIVTISTEGDKLDI